MRGFHFEYLSAQYGRYIPCKFLSFPPQATVSMNDRLRAVKLVVRAIAVVWYPAAAGKPKHASFTPKHLHCIDNRIRLPAFTDLIGLFTD